jgi:hypothetical protein
MGPRVVMNVARTRNVNKSLPVKVSQTSSSLFLMWAVPSVEILLR